MKVWTILLLSLALVSGQKCRALILSGGGAYGAYEVGAFQGLVASLPAAEVGYDVLSGISVGALNSVALSMYAKGSEVQASQFLSALWLNLGGSSNVIANWPGGVLQGLLLQSGIYDTTPLHNYMLKNCVNPPVRYTVMGTTSLNTGDFVVYNSAGRTITDLIQIFMTSSAIPGVFPSQKYNSDVYTDGSVTTNMNIISGIEACLATGASPSNIVVDMIACSAITISSSTAASMVSTDVKSRAEDIKSYYGSLEYLVYAFDLYPNVNYRYYLQPSKQLPGTSALDFSAAAIQGAISIGLSDAEYAVAHDIYAADVFAAANPTIYVS